MSSENQWFGAASDTGNVLAGTPLGALLGGSGAAAGFSIDYERVPQAIADLEHAAKFFNDRAKVAEGLANIRPPGTDGVSVNASARSAGGHRIAVRTIWPPRFELERCSLRTSRRSCART